MSFTGADGESASMIQIDAVALACCCTTARRRPSGAQATIPFEKPFPPGARICADVDWPDRPLMNATLVIAGPSRTTDI
jgi:hypothetical protein